MDDSPERRIEHLESIYAEQEYSLQTLNDTVSRQDREIARLTLLVDGLRQQLEAMKREFSSDTSPEHERPPHY